GGAYLALCMIAVLPILMTQPNPVFDSIHRQSPTVWVLMMAETALRPLVGILLLVSSIGALFLKHWARLGLLVFAVLMIVISIVDVVATEGWVNPIVSQPRPGATPFQQGFRSG